MDKIESIADELVNTIIDTDVFKRFSDAKLKVNDDELMKINSYKCLKAKLINEYSAETENEANLLYSQIIPNDNIREFIYSEKMLYELIFSIYDGIGDKIDKILQIDTEFVN